MKCEKGHNLAEEVICPKCNQTLYWVDSDEKYVICRGCNWVRKISEKIVHIGCGALSKSKIKWIKGYKP